MDVDVDGARIEREEQHIGRLALAMQELGIGLAHRVRNHAVAHVASVDEQVLRIGARPGGVRRAREAGERHAPGAGLHSDARFGEFASEQRRGALRQRLAAHMAARAAVVLDREADRRVRERDAAEDLVAVAELRLLALQELAPRRGVEIEVLHRHRGAGDTRGRFDGERFAAFAAQRIAVLGILHAARKRQAGDCGDRGERLAAKAHGRDRLQVLEAADLAGGVARERERQLVARDAGAVVFHLDAAHAALVERHGDAGCPGVEAVLEQLLEHRGRPLDHFAGRDLRDEELRQHADGAHHGIIESARWNSSPRCGTSPSISTSTSPPSSPSTAPGSMRCFSSSSSAKPGWW